MPKFAARSAMDFWTKHQLWTYADRDADEAVNSITTVINAHEREDARAQGVASFRSAKMILATTA